MIEFYVAPSTTKDRIAGISEMTPVKAPVCLSLCCFKSAIGTRKWMPTRDSEGQTTDQASR